MRITVSTGGLSRRVIAENPFEAVKVFIVKYQPSLLGQLAECRSKDLDGAYYVSMRAALEDLGIAYEEKNKRINMNELLRKTTKT